MNDDHLKASLVEFETAVKAVQVSLLSRNTEQIWNALARQEEAVSRLDALRSSGGNALAGASSRDSGIQRLMERCQTVLRANRALAGRFLDVVDQTLSQLGGRSRSATYSANPYASRRAVPLLVCQQG